MDYFQYILSIPAYYVFTLICILISSENMFVPTSIAIQLVLPICDQRHPQYSLEPRVYALSVHTPLKCNRGLTGLTLASLLHPRIKITDFLLQSKGALTKLALSLLRWV
ncbi:unnamed protein product [Bemisia tabaci]|uniref:Uncharacterized protein n=1 Tax=Bemisia tabaci TaxID=7038 RepID=A0AAI8UUT3_BEMTA|nr:unnamed protein product [Bemisia tabaci]